MNRISVAESKLAGNEQQDLLDCLDGGWISSHGTYITAFEDRFATFVGVEHAIATNNGISVLNLALVALGLNPNDEMIVLTVTYIATANIVRYSGATLVLVDSFPATVNVGP